MQPIDSILIFFFFLQNSLYHITHSIKLVTAVMYFFRILDLVFLLLTHRQTLQKC